MPRWLFPFITGAALYRAAEGGILLIIPMKTKEKNRIFTENLQIIRSSIAKQSILVYNGFIHNK